MNWYRNIKISQQIIENPKDLLYTFIGHDKTKGLTVEHEEFVWVWKDGVLDVKKIEGRTMNGEPSLHNRMWGFIVDNYYRGRAEKYKDQNSIISLIIPYDNRRFRDPPKSLISQLKDKFGSDAKIYIYK